MEGIEVGAYGFDGAEALTRREMSVDKISRGDDLLGPVQLPLLSLALGFSL